VVTATLDSDRRSGDIFVAPQNSPQVGPMILDDAGHLIWFDPLKGGSSKYYATNLQVQRYRGRPVLTWWQGEQFTRGEDVILNRAYRKVATVHAGNGYQADLHEFQITPQGTALIDALGLRRADLSSVGGPADGTVLDDVIQEIDIRSGRVLWQWHALGHVPVDASYEPYSPQGLWYDYFHLNSIQQLPNGNLLISARNTWAVYEISRKTGKVVWTLGGRYSDFRSGPGVHFEWQHDARLHTGGILSLFDDGSGGTPQAERQSSARILKVDVKARTVSEVRRFIHHPPLLTSASGNTELLPNGDVFVGWGQVSQLSQYSSTGHQIFNASFPLGVGTYRAFRFPWVGKPQTRPSIAVSAGTSGDMKVYASWNGATQVARWRVLGGSTVHHMSSLGVTARRTAFETSIRVTSGSRFFAVQALDAQGRVLGTSGPAGG
jgi:Arylsulfotransferase (ASST)